MMDWGDAGWGVGDWAAMSAMMIVCWGALVAFVVLVVRNSRSQENDPVSRADALLAERFARGEINGEEFTRSRELLRTRGSAPSHSGR